MNTRDVAIDAARQAGAVLLRNFQGKLQYQMKNTVDIVTQEDLDSEKLIIGKIREHFPEHNIYSEEQGQEQHDSPYTWVIDPMDGTINFSKGIEEFAVSISLCLSDEPILAVLYQPVLDKLFVAE